MSHLFAPFTLGALDLPSRIVMSPMARCRAGAGGVPTVLNAKYYAQRASAGLIIAEATAVTTGGMGFPFSPGIHNEAQADGWRGVTGAVHRAGGRILCQLFHAGRATVPALLPEGTAPVAPSAVALEGEGWTGSASQHHGTPRALEHGEVEEVVEAFRRAAEFARAAGFDGVEIHAANGFLLHQFLEDGTNRREDEYGGSIENRIRLVLQVLRAAVGVWGRGRVGLRLSPLNPFNGMRDSDPVALYAALAAAVNAIAPAYLHLSEIDPDSPGSARGANFLGAPNAISGQMREIFAGALITNGGYDLPRAGRVLAAGAADLVAFGTLFLANPDLPARLRRGGPFNAPDPKSFYGGAAAGYTDYPALP